MITNITRDLKSQRSETDINNALNKKKVTFSELDEVFDEIEIVDEWAVVYHPGNEFSTQEKSSNFSQKIYKEIKSRKGKPSSNNSKSESKDAKLTKTNCFFKSPVRNYNTQHCEISLVNEKNPVVQKVSYFKPSNFSDLKASSRKTKAKHQNQLRKRRVRVLKEALIKLKSLKEANGQMATDSNEFNEDYKVFKESCIKSLGLSSTKKNKINHRYEGDQLANQYSSAKGSKYASVNLENDLNDENAHESLLHYKEESNPFKKSNHCLKNHKVIKRNHTLNDKEAKGSDYCSITSQNLKKFNCRENRSLSQESLIGGIMKGSNLRFSLPSASCLSPFALPPQCTTDENTQTNVVKVNVIQVRVGAAVSLLNQSKKLATMSLLSPTLSLLGSSICCDTTNINKMQGDEEGIDSEKEEINSLGHCSTNES